MKFPMFSSFLTIFIFHIYLSLLWDMHQKIQKFKKILSRNWIMDGIYMRNCHSLCYFCSSWKSCQLSKFYANEKVLFEKQTRQFLEENICYQNQYKVRFQNNFWISQKQSAKVTDSIRHKRYIFIPLKDNNYCRARLERDVVSVVLFSPDALALILAHT